MHILFKRYLAAAVLVMTAILSTSASAGLSDALNGMFMQNSTSGGAFASQSRGGFVGGGAGLRSPVRNINLIAFDPPRFSAGCGGIDLFGGSFSFINADQLVALFRQIAANAVGVAFKAAIDAINPALGKLMQDFQNKLQALNQMMKNTCAVANSIVKSFTDPSARKEMADTAANAAQTAKGSFSDLFAGFSNMFSSPNAGSDKATKDGSCEECGNPVWKALTDTNAGQFLGNPDAGEADTNRANEVVMSMIGAVIMTNPDDSGSNTDGSPKVKVGQIFSPTLTLNNFKDGSNGKSTPLRILHCTDGYDRNKCTKINANDSMSFEGTLGYTNRMLFGSSIGPSAGVDPSSIVGKLSYCTAGKCGFTVAQQSFIEAISVPLLAMIRQVQQSPGAVQSVATQLAPVIANELAASYGKAAIYAANQVFNGVKGMKPDFVEPNIKKLTEELAVIQAEVNNQQQRVTQAKAVVDMILANNPSVFAKPNGI
ncbi:MULTISPECIES: conjugal transfer protein TraH [Pseudomonas]|uniref:conjugal transfer protein TraH n=1 Tax=Pseudomonas TaxID=286 RepID=UPI00387B02D4